MNSFISQKQKVWRSYRSKLGFNAKYTTRWRGTGAVRFLADASGVVVIDKTRSLAGLLVTCYLNSQKVRDELTYKHFYGDKESYWLSHALTGTPYHFVPGYSGGLGRITHSVDGREKVCTMQLLHILESTGEPLWFNNAIVEFKGADDDAYIDPEGWVGHDGRWYGGGQRFPNELCVEMPETEGLLGIPQPVKRIDKEFKLLLERIVQRGKEYDELMEEEGLISLNRKQ